VGTEKGGLNCYQKETDNFVHYRHYPDDPGSISHNNITALNEDHNKILWIGTAGGSLNSLSPNREVAPGKKLVFNHHRSSTSDSRIMMHNIISAIYVDPLGVIWVGTNGGGLYFTAGNRFKFKHYRSLPDVPNSLSNPVVWDIYEDKQGILWLGTSEGLNRIDRRNGLINRYPQEPGKKGGLSHSEIRTIYQDQQGILWLGSYGGGIIKTSKVKDNSYQLRFNNYNPSNSAGNIFKNLRVVEFYGKKKGWLWVGTHGNGLFKINTQTGACQQFKLQPQNKNNISSNYIWAVHEDQNGMMWFGTNGSGLSRYDKQTGTFQHFQHDLKKNTSISNNNVFCIHESPAKPGILWLATYGGGLNRFDTQTETAIHFTIKNGFPSNKIYGILEEPAASPNNNRMGKLWLSTNKGLWQFDPESGKLRTFGLEEGVQSSEFNAGAFFRSDRGEMFFGGINGFNAFYPNHLKQDKNIPPVVLTDFKLFNRSLLLNPKGKPIRKTMESESIPLSRTEKIRLNYKENFFSFQFSVLDYFAPQKNLYAYKLEGLDKDWIMTGANNRVANYTDLKPGEYTFRVKGANSDGTWNNTGTSVAITITPPYWKTWWFQGILGLVGIWVIAFLSRKRIDIIKRNAQQEQHTLKQQMEKRQLEKELKLKADFTAMVVHDLRNPLTAVLGYSDLLETEAHQLDIPKVAGVISRSSLKMLNLINDMLDISKFEAGKIKLNLNPGSLEQLSRDIFELMNPLLVKKNLTVSYIFPGLPFILLDKDRIHQVITNLVGNAVKFSPVNGRLLIETRQLNINGNKYQEFLIQDEGPGVPEERRNNLFEKYAQLHSPIHTGLKGTGLGLAVSRMIIEMHKGEIGYIPAKSGGSIFYFRLPGEYGTISDSNSSNNK
jgi:signal transduction histidine kinase/ligand-binding sensor domain-containing protein